MEQPKKEEIKNLNVTETMADADLFVRQQKKDPILEPWWRLTEQKGQDL